MNRNSAATPYLNALGQGGGLNVSRYGSTSKTYGSMFWAGLPVKIRSFALWNIELDLNYGYGEEMGKFDVLTRNDPNDIRRGSTQRQGWLVKALIGDNLDLGHSGHLRLVRLGR